MAFLRRFKGYKKGAPGWEEKSIVENIIGALSQKHDGVYPLYFRNHPCPLEELPKLYADYVSHWQGVETVLSRAVEQATGETSLLRWLMRYDFFKFPSCGLYTGFSFEPDAADVMVECYYQQHGFSVSVLDIEPRIDWNKCPKCGHINNDARFKYAVLCSATPELVGKWCAFFKGSEQVIPARELDEQLYEKCSHCPFVDCPFSWGFRSKDGKGRGRAGVSSFLMPQDALVRFGHFKNFSAFLKDLAAVVEEEHWGSDLEYLRSYITMTFYFQLFRRDGQMGLIETARFAWFNSGLLERETSEDVFVCFVPDESGWEYKGITWKGAPNGGFDLFKGGSGLIPVYRTPYVANDELIWNAALDLQWKENFEHIYFDNLDRILNCKSFRNGRCGIAIPEKYAEARKTNRFATIPRWDAEARSAEKETVFYLEVEKLFEKAVEHAKRRLMRNYKWVLPIYYPMGRSMSFALPISLAQNGFGREPDLALVCSRCKIGALEYYDARTILERGMIYQDARQVCKPYAEWIAALLEDDFVGRVTRVDPHCGFIFSDAGKTLRFMLSESPAIAGCRIPKGCRVRFEYRKSGQYLEAFNVRFVNGGPVPQQSPREHVQRPSPRNVTVNASNRLIGRVTGIGSLSGYIEDDCGKTYTYYGRDNPEIDQRLRNGDRVSFLACRRDGEDVAYRISLLLFDESDSSEPRGRASLDDLRSCPRCLEY